MIEVTQITPAPLPERFNDAEKAEVNARKLTPCEHCGSGQLEARTQARFNGLSMVRYQCIACYGSFTSYAPILQK